MDSTVESEIKVRTPHVYSMPEAFMQDQSVPARWRILGIVNGFAISGKSFYGSNKWLMQQLKCSEQTVSNAMEELEKMGEVRCERTRRSRMVYRTLRDPNQLGSRPKPTRVSDPNQLGTISDSISDNRSNATQSVAPVKVETFFQGTKLKERTDDLIPMSLDQFVLMTRGSAYRHIRLIGEYADEREFGYTTRGQWRQFGIRNLRIARQLAPFFDAQIAQALVRLHKDYEKMERKEGSKGKWGMETIIKYLEEANAKIK